MSVYYIMNIIDISLQFLLGYINDIFVNILDEVSYTYSQVVLEKLSKNSLN